ncbi:polymer-forming cytoskeletal protein [uncultured Vagococcus sp.]|uniref:polymer-forming cytoskeletal protein n=1 Tax=uncultured Vagococcus sp. TaxID=189676 RepID=UPI0028D4DEA0|nr:polymer-forming cytoskeletal protein [uncultured Vagococcus sp.]
MKYVKIVTLAATLLVVGGGLAACSPDKGTSESSSASSSEVTKESTSSEDVVTGASISDKADVIEKALSADGNWIVAVTGDVTFDKDLTVAGEFHDKGETSGDIYRKLALYAQDDDRKVTDEYTITAPKVIVESENFNIVHGTVKGDIEVKANGFVLDAAKVDGNIVFEKAEYKDSAVLDKDGASVTGETTVAE